MTDLHISEMAANRYLLDECDPQEKARLDEHLQSCEACAQYLEGLRSFDAKLPVAVWSQKGVEALAAGPHAADAPEEAASRPPRQAIVPPPRPPLHQRGAAAGRARRRWVLAATALVSMASFLLVIWFRPPTQDDVLRKGSDFALEVFAKGAEKPREVGDGDAVHPGERLGFRVHSEMAGFVLIAGVDDQGSAYPCHPASGRAQSWEPSAEAVVVDGAVELDNATGTERIVGLWCPDAFAFEDIVTTLQAGADAPLPLLRPGCAQREIVLEKQVRISP